jgi:nucleoside-diphosphate-sugar epimerase
VSRILIAGCGDVGNALGIRLGRRSDMVWGLRRDPAALAQGIRAVQADLAQPSTLGVLPKGLDAVVYAAAADAYHETAYRQIYVDGVNHMRRALERSGQNPRFIFVSSTSVYGQNHGEWVDEDSSTDPVGFSGRLMLEGEALLQAYAGEAVSVRFGGIYGPGRNRLIDAVRSGSGCQGEPPIYTNRIHKDDCAGVLMHLLDLVSPQRIYLGVDSHPAPQCEVMHWLSERLGVPVPSRQRRPGAGSGKRCGNRRLLASGYRLLYSTYREGYEAVIGTLI